MYTQTAGNTTPALLRKGEQVCRVCDVARAKNMLAKLKAWTGKDEKFLKSITTKCKKIRDSKRGFGSGKRN